MNRAVIFDLDETLYRERRFALSGYDAVSAYAHSRLGLPRGDVFCALSRAHRQGQRQRALQVLCDQYHLSHGMVREFVDIIRAHVPRLRLPRITGATLRGLRSSWKVGVLTNGLPGVQARKVKALGLADHVDDIVYAEEHGDGGGKPDPEPFLVAARRLGVEPGRCIFVGDDPLRDIAGSRNVGMRAVRLDRRRGHLGGEEIRADMVVRALSEVPNAVRALWAGGISRVH
jgi:putative hydrolase of the HAD superfamily